MVIFFHGANSTTLQERYVNIAKRLITKNLGNCLLYESSRNISYSDYVKQKLSFEEYVKTFEPKTFLQELQDAQNIIEYAIREETIQPIELHLVGISLGGIISSFLVKDYPQIKSITLIGSGSNVTVQNGSVLNNLPSEKQILKNYKDFSGLLFALHGTDDTIILPKSIEKVFATANNALDKELSFIKGADHRLRTINGQDQEYQLREVIYYTISKALGISDLFS